MKTSLGIDYAFPDKSRAPDFAKAKKAGAEFAIVRTSYGISMDTTFRRDWAKLKDAGIIRGAYMFPVIHATREPEPQVAAFAKNLALAGGLVPGIDLPPVFDVEFPKGIAKTGMTRLECLDWVLRAMHALEDTFGVLPMLYTSARVWDGQDEDSLDADRVPVPAIADCPLWLARYPYKAKIASHHLPSERDGLQIPPVPKQLGDTSDVWIHQYQGDAVGFPGFTNTVDNNRFFPISRALAVKGSEKVKWIQKKLNAATAKRTKVAFDVLVVDGDWGDRTERALREFQSLRKIPGTGVVDVRTFCALSWA